MRSKKTVNRYIRLTCGCLLSVAGVCGIFYGARAGLAQMLYFNVRYGSRTDCVETLLSAAERAQQLYPHNFYLPFLAADRGLEAAWNADCPNLGERYLRAAAYWSKQGLRINPYRQEINLIQARVLEAEGDPDAAIAWWLDFAHEMYWNPDHHARTVELALRNGRLEVAEQWLEMARRSGCYRRLRRQLQALRPTG